jgi:hypothetical protein
VRSSWIYVANSFWGCGISDVAVATDFVHITSRRGGAEIAGSQIVAGQHGDFVICHSVRLADGGILRATCPTLGPTVTAGAPQPGSIYLGTDLADTRVWATMDGRIVATARRAHSIAELTQPPSTSMGHITGLPDAPRDAG